MNEIIENEKTIVENMIYEIKGKQVMLDADLTILYKTETKRINEKILRATISEELPMPCKSIKELKKKELRKISGGCIWA